ncbi:P1 family peptidase [Trinickia caryophylli]|nr:S58 family peptidase [Trinickia caryophylli]TRX15436.1 P1 family peptidase [Trinickia caryophylli]
MRNAAAKTVSRPKYPAPPHIGRLEAGARGTIADVKGVSVGHCTLDDGAIQTGVTVIRPHGGDIYRRKVPAAAAVVNGFGKSLGLVQLEELGVLDTPIALTNTFGVAAVAEAQAREAIRRNPRIGREWPTVNALVLECNDGFLNDIQAFAVRPAHYGHALDAASPRVGRGAVGAGRGMSCFDLKGGIGSASRIARTADAAYTVGALVLANFGRLPMLTLAGEPFGRLLDERLAQARRPHSVAGPARVRPERREQRWQPEQPEQGSIIMTIATDAPLDARQLRRLAMRSAAGLARTGSVYGHGSGDIALAFSTAYTVPHDAPFVTLPPLVADARLDVLFEACADSVEQAIADALCSAVSVTGRDGHRRLSLLDTAESLGLGPELERFLVRHTP